MLVEVSGQRFSFPQVCACCGHESDASLRASHSKSKGKRVVHTKTWVWEFPYCKACLAHVSAWNRAAGYGFLWSILVAIVSGGIVSSFKSDIGGLVVVVLWVIGWLVATARYRRRARLQCSPDCACAFRAVNYVDWYGSTHSFDIRSRTYAARFMLSNRAKVINLTRDGHTLLEWANATFGGVHHESFVGGDNSLAIRLSVKTSAADESEEDRLLQGIAKIESLKGPASRRAALDLALKHLSTDEAKKRLQLEAARIEVRSAFDKIDSLKTKAAKERVLQETLSEIHSRNLDPATLEECVSSLSTALAQQ